jgi:GNAT superfamily N-acetyltransferase
MRRPVTAPEVATLGAAGEIAAARTPDGHVVGAIQLHQESDVTSEFGMLVSAPEHRGTGIGRALLDFARHALRP